MWYSQRQHLCWLAGAGETCGRSEAGRAARAGLGQGGRWAVRGRGTCTADRMRARICAAREAPQRHKGLHLYALLVPLRPAGLQPPPELPPFLVRSLVLGPDSAEAGVTD